MKLLCCFSESPRTRKKSKNEDDDDEEQSNYMSLDVLAQVASETLQSEPTGKRNAKKVFDVFQICIIVVFICKYNSYQLA